MVSHTGAAGANSYTGYNNSVTLNAASQTVTGVNGHSSSVTVTAGTITTYNAYLANTNSVSGTLTTAIGLRINAQNGTTNSWGIYQVDSGDDNYFAGRVGIGAEPTSTAKTYIFDDTTGSGGTENGLHIRMDSNGSVTGGAYRGLYIQIDCNTGDTLENARAIQIDGPTGSGTFTNLPAAIMILDQKTGPQSGIANPISIYAPGSSDKAVFGGLMVVGGLTNPASVSVGLEVQGTTKAFLVSRMTTTQRNALTAVNGMIIYNTSTNAFNFYENGSWVTGSGLA